MCMQFFLNMIYSKLLWLKELLYFNWEVPDRTLTYTYDFIITYIYESLVETRLAEGEEKHQEDASMSE